MLVAVAVVGLLAGIAARPMKTFYRRMAFDNNVKGIRELMQTARSRAMADPMVHCGVYFDTKKNPPEAYAFFDDYKPEGYAYDKGKDRVYLKPVTLHKGLTMRIPKGYPKAVVFRGDGSGYLSQQVTLSDGRLTDTLDVLASTGRIKVRK